MRNHLLSKEIALHSDESETVFENKLKTYHCYIKKYINPQQIYKYIFLFPTNTRNVFKFSYFYISKDS